MKNTWDGIALRRRLQALQELLESLLTTRDSQEQGATPLNKSEILGDQWTIAERGRQNSAKGDEIWKEVNSKRPYPYIHSQLLPNATDAIRQLKPINPTKNENIEKVKTTLLRDIALLETQVTTAIRVTDATPIIPQVTDGLLVAQADHHTYRMQQVLPLQQHFERAIAPFWNKEITGKRAVPKTITISQFNLLCAQVSGILEEIEVFGEESQVFIFKEIFMITIKTAPQPDDLIICC